MQPAGKDWEIDEFIAIILWHSFTVEEIVFQRLVSYDGEIANESLQKKIKRFRKEKHTFKSLAWLD